MKRSTLILAGLAAVAALAALAPTARAAGLLVPTDEKLPPLAVKYLRVDARIENQAATTHVVQEFANSTDRPLECTYIFPLPKGAAIKDFAMYIDGKRMKGELLDKNRAREIYEDIVRRARDPGLLEYMDHDLLRLRIFPVPAKGTQKVELEYTQLVPMDDGLSEYVFPLRVGEKASRTLEDFTVTVRLRSDVPLANVYSPTHEVGVSRPSDHEAVAGMETKAALLDRDFQLFYTVAKKDFGLSLMTYRPDPAQPGMFLMLLAPRTEAGDARRVPRDLALVLDTSGSMKGDKLDQAKRALVFCLKALAPGDRFAVVQFSTIAQGFAEGWSEATPAAVEKAAAWVGAFEATGGTNISEALTRVLALPVEGGRTATVLFVTDGRPTVDVTDAGALAARVKEHNKAGLRLFTFGVGDDVNTKLLDLMSETTGALTEYVRPGEAIDGKMTRLYSKMTHPVMTHLELAVPGVKIAETYPRALPDLFRGSQVVVVGSYTGDGDSVIRLKGRMGEKTEEFVYEGTFPAKATGREFIAPLYAHRKIGFLLDQIRLNGETPELKDEVVRLSLAYGIETPYTSYLVLESAEQYKRYNVTLSTQPAWGATGPATAAPASRPAERAAAESRAKEQADRLDSTYAATPPAAPQLQVIGMGGGASAAPAPAGVAGVRAGEEALRDADTGAKAVDIAQELQRMRRAENAAQTRGVQQVNQRAGRQFANYRGVWVDERFQGNENLVKVRWGSEAYFQLIRARDELRPVFNQGQRIVAVTSAGQAVAVDVDEGREAAFTEEELKGLFAGA